jgi:hypothetical protein
VNAILLLVTALSLLTAVAAGLIAWRAVSENRRRSDARVALLADAVRADETPDSRPVELTHLLDHPEPTRSRQRLTVAATATALLVIVAVLGRAAGSGPGRAASDQSPQAAAGRLADRPPSTLDLVALTHELGRDGQLELHGQVRNGAGGANMEHVSVVALLFDRQGAYLSSSRAPLEVSSTDGGATFFVAVPEGERVGRYRVSFRAGDRIVPHVDRRQAQ